MQVLIGVSLDNYIKSKIELVNSKINSFNWLVSAKNWLQEESAQHHSLDIKDKLGRHGFLFNGKYISAETAGNYLFGANMESLRQFGSLDNIAYPITNKESVFYKAAKKFGAHHNETNGVNNPTIEPYYGEIPYSGRGIVRGYYGNNSNNAIFNSYGNAALFGGKKINK